MQFISDFDSPYYRTIQQGINSERTYCFLHGGRMGARWKVTRCDECRSNYCDACADAHEAFKPLLHARPEIPPIEIWDRQDTPNTAVQASPPQKGLRQTRLTFQPLSK
jgi:hypothetical protein